MGKTIHAETLCGRNLPAGWERHDWHPTNAPDGIRGAARYYALNGLSVLETIEIQSNGERWHHVSLSYADRLPSWEDVKLVKRLFIGHDREAYQVLPPESEYVNVHPFVFHLWRPMDRLRVVPGMY